MKIALVSQKGGSGKTTVAASLAGYWMKAGRSVCVVDADALGILSACWPDPPWDTAAAGQDFILTDTAGFRTAAAIDALAAADVALIPARPSLPDLIAASSVLEQVAELNKARRRHPARPVVVFTQVPAQGRVAAHMMAEAQRLKLPVAPAHIGMRAVFAEAALRGSSPAELEPRGRGALEVAALAKYLERITRG